MIRFTREYEAIGAKAPVWQDCRTLADAAAKEVSPGKVVIKNNLPAGAEVFADSLIIKVFYNLTDNAVRYGEKITTIRFSAEEHNGEHILVCEDDGVGIPAEEKEKIFNRGFGKNTGMGLFLSREILSITGISITETGEPGMGARFEISVPGGDVASCRKEGPVIRCYPWVRWQATWPVDWLDTRQQNDELILIRSPARGNVPSF